MELLRVLHHGSSEQDWISTIKTLEIQKNLAGADSLLLLKSLVPSVVSPCALGNIVHLFSRLVSELIKDHKITKDRKRTREILTIVQDFWSMFSNQHAILTGKTFGSYDSSFYKVLPPLAAIYIDLFIAVYSTKPKTQKFAERLYSWLVFELDEWSIKMALLDVSECLQKAGVKLLRPLFQKLFLKLPSRIMGPEYLQNILVLKKWVFVSEELTASLQTCLDSEVPHHFLGWLEQHWSKSQECLQRRVGLKKLKVREFLQAVDQSAHGDLLNIFSSFSWSQQSELGVAPKLKEISKHHENVQELFIIDKKGVGNKVHSADGVDMNDNGIETASSDQHFVATKNGEIDDNGIETASGDLHCVDIKDGEIDDNGIETASGDLHGVDIKNSEIDNYGIKTASGGLHCVDMKDGEIDDNGIETASGDLHCLDIKDCEINDNVIETASGDLNCVDIKDGEIDDNGIETASGDLHCVDIKNGEIDDNGIETASGDLHCVNIKDGEIDNYGIKTASGDLHCVDMNDGEIDDNEIETASGDLHCLDIKDGEIDNNGIKTASGDLHCVDMNDGEIDNNGIKTASGDLHCLDIKDGEINDNGIETASGDLHFVDMNDGEIETNSGDLPHVDMDDGGVEAAPKPQVIIESCQSQNKLSAPVISNHLGDLNTGAMNHKNGCAKNERKAVKTSSYVHNKFVKEQNNASRISRKRKFESSLNKDKTIQNVPENTVNNFSGTGDIVSVNVSQGDNDSEVTVFLKSAENEQEFKADIEIFSHSIKKEKRKQSEGVFQMKTRLRTHSENRACSLPQNTVSTLKKHRQNTDINKKTPAKNLRSHRTKSLPNTKELIALPTASTAKKPGSSLSRDDLESVSPKTPTTRSKIQSSNINSAEKSISQKLKERSKSLPYRKESIALPTASKAKKPDSSLSSEDLVSVSPKTPTTRTKIQSSNINSAEKSVSQKFKERSYFLRTNCAHRVQTSGEVCLSCSSKSIKAKNQELK